MEDTKEGLLFSTVEEETVEESSQEDESKAVKLKEEVRYWREESLIVF